MTEWGLFSDEGCVERGFFTEESAKAALARHSPEDGLSAEPCCNDHPDRPAAFCEDCLEEPEA